MTSERKLEIVSVRPDFKFDYVRDPYSFRFEVHHKFWEYIERHRAEQPNSNKYSYENCIGSRVTIYVRHLYLKGCKLQEIAIAKTLTQAISKADLYFLAQRDDLINTRIRNDKVRYKQLQTR